MSEEKKLNGTVIVTYRCNARCSMCNRYKAPSKPEEEISIETIKKLPKMYFTNITGGEPFIRTDLKDIVGHARQEGRLRCIRTFCLLQSNLSRRALHNAKIERTVVVAGGGEETLTAVSTLLAQCLVQPGISAHADATDDLHGQLRLRTLAK